MSEMPKYKKKDFVSDQDVRWCPGCGDYTILASVQMAMTKIGKRKELLEKWYREQLRSKAREMIGMWEKRLGVETKRVIIQKMN